MTTLTSFCAANIAFIIGIYDADISGDTDKMRIRGSEAGSLDSTVAVVLGGLRILFRSTNLTT